MKLVSRYRFLLLLTFLISNNLIGQKLQAQNIYKDAVSIDESSLSNSKKIAALSSLKKNTELNKLNKDRNYILILVKLAKYEYLQNDNINLSIRYTQNALDIYHQLHDNAPDDICINAWFNLAYYYQNSILYNKALTYYDSVLQFYKKHEARDYLILARNNKAKIYFSLGDHEKAKDESTIGIEETLLCKDSSSYTSFLNFRAYSLLFQNQLQQSFADVKSNIPVAQKINDTYELATAYEIKGLLYQKEERYDSAEFYLKKAITIRPIEAIWYQTTATDYYNLALLFLLTKNFKEAEKTFYKTIFYGNKCLRSDRSLTLFMAYVSMAEMSTREHKYDKAKDNYRLALSFTNIKTDNFLLAPIPSAQIAAVGYKDVMFSFLFGKTELLLQLYKETHQKSYLQACLQTARTTDTLITQTRNENLGEGSKLYWRNETRKFFADIIEACYLLDDVTNAFYFIEKSRAVLLNDKWNEIAASSFLHAAEANKIEALRIKLIEYQQQLTLSQPDNIQYTEFESNIALTRDTLYHFISALEKKYPIYYQSKYADSVPSFQSLQQYLAKNNQSFVYYFMGDSSMYALGISKDKTKFIKINTDDFDSHKLSQFMQLCSNRSLLNNNYDTFTLLSQTICNKLFKPLQVSKGNVAICTDNFFLPFEALCSDKDGKNFLLTDYNFSYVYSARSLMKPFTCSKPTGNFIGFAPVSFSASLDVAELKQSATAVEKVADFYTNNIVFTEKQATRNNFFTNASRYSVVTIFSHAKADTTDTEPVLYMQDALIHLSELQMLKNPSVQFVLLSACQTNIGRNAAGEGIYSLARGFASAGIPAVSATLWKADEQAIYSISAKFNEYLSKGMNKSEALQKAKIWYLNNCDKEHALPYYWANLVLIGSSQPISLLSASRTWIWIASSVVLLLLVVSIIFFFYRKAIHKNSRSRILSSNKNLV